MINELSVHIIKTNFMTSLSQTSYFTLRKMRRLTVLISDGGHKENIVYVWKSEDPVNHQKHQLLSTTFSQSWWSTSFPSLMSSSPSPPSSVVWIPPLPVRDIITRSRSTRVFTFLTILSMAMAKVMYSWWLFYRDEHMSHFKNGNIEQIRQI